MYLLVGIWGSGRKEYAAMKLTLMLLAGSAFMLVGFIAMYFTSNVHTFDIRALGRFVRYRPECELPKHLVSPPLSRFWGYLRGVPVPHLVAGRVRIGPDRRFHAARGRFKEFGWIQYYSCGVAFDAGWSQALASVFGDLGFD